MTLRQEIQPYIDGNGLVAPRKCDPTKQGSDNGVMFTSEYYIMLKHQNEYHWLNDPLDYVDLIVNCISKDLLCRAPGDLDQEGPDDYYGVFAACAVLPAHGLGDCFLNSIMKYKGFLNNHDGTRTWQSFLIRQPQLLAAAYAAAGRAPIWSWPLYWYAALVIATSCVGVHSSNADSRRLAWLLIQSVTTQSWLCKIASKIWYSRLYRTYGLGGMKEVARIYYENDPPHPFINFWVD